MPKNNWYHVSSHGAVLFCIAAQEDCTISDLAETMSLSRRQIRGVVGDLRRAGMVHVRKNGRRHHYSVNLEAPLRHPVLKGYTLRILLGALVGQARQP